MSVDMESPEPARPKRTPAIDRKQLRRRRRVWRILILVLVALAFYALYGGRFGGPSPLRDVHGDLQTLRYPSSLGRPRIDRVADGYERIQVAGFGEEKARGPKAAVQRVLKLTRAGGMLFEVRGLASDGERDALLARAPYDCARKTETQLEAEVRGISMEKVSRSFLFGWLPASVQICGTRVHGHVLEHVSGFATDATWHRESAQLERMLESWQVHQDLVPHDAEGCRMHATHDPPLYVKFRDEALAQVGEISADSVEWIDLPYEREGSVGRFSPALLDEVVGGCAEEQARFALVVEGGADPQSPAGQEAHHAFLARCEPLFPMLRFFGGEKLDPELLPRPSEGWTQKLDDNYVPALCMPTANAP